MVKIRFLGAAGEVTGSCYLLRTDRARVLVDFGMHQGGALADLRNRRRVIPDPSELDAVILTHAHLDHSGRLPLLTNGNGSAYRGEIHATPATCEITPIMLADSARLQVQDAERERVRRGRQGKVTDGALYDEDQAAAVCRLLRALPYDEAREVAPGVRARLVDAGHILGSASVELTIDSGGRRFVLVMSGDVGEVGSPILRDPTTFATADALILESTYGDRDHKALGPTLDELVEVVSRAQRDGGKVLIPAFAIGRTQTLIYHLAALRRSGRMGPIPVYIDSPMASSITALYRAHPELYDEQTRREITAGEPPLAFPGLRFTGTAEESRTLNTLEGPAVVIAASGMCTGGRILHHLKHHLWEPTTKVVIAGYQSEGSLGRQLVDGARRVSIMGEPIAVRASVHTLGGFSAHAGRTTLLRWAGGFSRAPDRVFLTHGESGPRRALADALAERWGAAPALPGYEEEVEL
ncbi:MAG: MBL fold metallo-hydrolase [Phycisphaerae bacterium]|nr:MBL fold metallo-hydrolase [Phycisphaerae bacterium]